MRLQAAFVCLHADYGISMPTRRTASEWFFHRFHLITCQVSGLMCCKPLSCKRFIVLTDDFLYAPYRPSAHAQHLINPHFHSSLRQHHDCDVEITVFACIAPQTPLHPNGGHAHACHLAQRLRHAPSRRACDRACGTHHRNQQ